MRVIFHTLNIILVLFMVYSCDANRLNPLDPQNPNYKKPDTTKFKISGTIKTQAAPQLAISNVEIFWANDDKFLKSDENGNFTFKDLRPQNGWLVFEKNEYYKDSTFIEWDTLKSITSNKFLVTLPSVKDFSIYSEVLYNHSQNQFNLGFSVEINDKDNRVDSVIIINQSLNIYKNLTEVLVNKFEIAGKISSFGLNSLEQVIGRDFELVFIDNNLNRIVAGNSTLHRIIKDEIIFRSPINQEVVSSKPELKWKIFEPGFNFNYKIEIWTRETGSVKILEYENIPSDSVSFLVPDEISTVGINDFNWVIWCIDEFNNKSRSKPASFIVN